MATTSYMKYVDIGVAVLLVIGGLNLGLMGFLGFDLIAYLFGDMAILSRMFYGLVGICAVYQALEWKAIPRRWGCTAFPGVAVTEGAVK